MAVRHLPIVQASDADVLVKTGTSFYCGCKLIGVAAGTMKVYDTDAVANAANTNLIGGCGVTAANACDEDTPLEPIKCANGIVVVVTGAGNLGSVRYK
jgi:hypothetical protein